MVIYRQLKIKNNVMKKCNLNFVLLLFLFHNLVWTQCANIIKTGDSNAYIKKIDGTFLTWGFNESGQLGDGTLINRRSPVLLNFSDFSNLEKLSAATFHTIAIKDNGTLWAWGRNNYGELGDGTLINKNTPTQIGTDTDWKMVASGTSSFAIKTDGTLWAWGDNSSGQLGDGTMTNKLVPTQIGSDTDWKEIDSRFSHVLAIKDNGTLWAWGSNYSGQLGDGTTITKIIPTQIGSDNNWKSISSGYQHSVAQKLDGSVFVWGENSDGQLGDGTNIDKHSPIPIALQGNWISIKAGGNHTIALKDNGTIWGCGGNTFFQLDNTHINKNVFTQLTTQNDWILVNPAGNSTFAINEDFEIYGWGSNDVGEIGIGSPNYDIINPTLVTCQVLNTYEANTNIPISIYPNPVTDNLFIQNNSNSEIENISILDITGSVILKIKNSTSINLEKLSKGVYFIKIYSNGTTYTNKFFKL